MPTATAALTIWHLTGQRCGQSERFAVERIAIGRGGQNDLAFDALLERSVSHRHCEIRTENGSPILYDLGSLNGTYVNGDRVDRALLQHGDEVGLGREGPRFRIGLADEDFAPEALRATARSSGPEPSNLWLRPPKRTRALLPLALCVGLALALLCLAWNQVALHRLEARIERLESASSLALHLAPRFEGETALVYGVIFREDDGAELIRRELGAGVLWREDCLLSTRLVVEAARGFLARQKTPGFGARITICCGLAGEEAPVRGYWLADDPKAPESLLGALQIEGPLRLDKTPPLGAGESSEVRWFLPGEAPLATTVVLRTRLDGFRAQRPEETVLLRLREGPDISGVPLFDHEGSLIGVALGPGRPREAVSTAILDAFLNQIRREATRSL